MIISTLNGGLGSQMCQYAAGRTLADKLGTDLYLDLSWYKLNAKDTKRDYLLDRFNIRAKEIEGNVNINIYKEPTLFYNEIPLIDNIKLIGYFMNYRYCDKSMYKDFEPTKEAGITDTQFLKTNYISIHIRRGDKVNSQKHYALDLDYYLKAMLMIEREIDEFEYSVFSDDIEYCTSNLTAKYDMITFVNNDEITDLILQSYCKHNIIANSSFSWWAAILNQNPDKIVIAPKKYYRDSEENYDIYPKEWRLI